MDIEDEINRTITLAMKHCISGDWDAFTRVFSSGFLNETVMKQTFFESHDILNKSQDVEWTTEISKQSANVYASHSTIQSDPRVFLIIRFTRRGNNLFSNALVLCPSDDFA